jgi:inner membrane protein
MYEAWFMWAIIGFVCIGLEIVMPGFVIFFFGIGGLLTAICSLVPFISDILWLQVLIFIALSVMSLLFLRRHFSRIFLGSIFDSRKGNAEEDGVGKIAEVIETVGSIVEGRIRFQGTTWKARSREGDIQVGKKVRILSREGITYIVESIGDETSTDSGGKA